MSARVVVIVSALALTTAVAACARTVSGSGTALPAPTRASTMPSGVPTGGTGLPMLPVDWVRTTDADTAVSFELPGTPKKTEQPDQASDGTPAVKRIYEVDLTKGLALSVAIETGAPGHPVQFSSNLTPLADALVAQFHTVGAKDAVVLEKRTLTVDGHLAFRFRFSFTPLTPSDKVIWFVEAIDLDSALVVAQTIYFPPTGTTTPALVASLRAAQSRLVAGITLR